MTKIEDPGMDLRVVYMNEENLYIVPFCNDHFKVWPVFGLFKSKY